jgi:hypothetical protein
MNSFGCSFMAGVTGGYNSALQLVNCYLIKTWPTQSFFLADDFNWVQQA